MIALTVPRPLVWLLARGVVRDYTIHTNPASIVGSRIALLCSAGSGDHMGYRTLAVTLRGTDFEGTSVAQVRYESPKGAVVGTAVLASCVQLADGAWRVHLDDAWPERPKRCAEPELLMLPEGVLT